MALFCTTDVLGGLKVEGKEEISKAGRGGLQKYQTTISFTVGGIAMALYVFLEVRASHWPLGPFLPLTLADR